MKRTVIFLLIFITISFAAAGCSVGKNANRPEKATTTAAQVEKSKEAKNISEADDKDLLSLASDGDEELNLSNDIDIDAELEDIEALLSEDDLLSDIPSEVEMK